MVTVRVAVFLTPYVAEIVTLAFAVTVAVFMVKVAVACPAGIVTVEPFGNVAAALPLVRLTTAPPVGAFPVSVTVPIELAAPPFTVVGLSVREKRIGGVTVNVPGTLPPLYVAVRVTVVDAATGEVVTVKAAEVACPASTRTLAGTDAAELGLERLTTASPAGALPVSVTVPDDGTPPGTLGGLNVMTESAGG